MLDAELSGDVDAARFIMDDGYAVGSATVVFDAIQRFGEAVAELRSGTTGGKM